jgi:hypothetical protein
MAIWRWVLGASVLGAAAAAVACSSSSSGGSPDAGGEAAAEDGGDGGSCTSLSASVATFDAGAGWACVQTACATSIAACGQDCVCNNASFEALNCVAEAGVTSIAAQATQLNSCLMVYLTPLTSETNVATFGECLLTTAKTACVPSSDAGEGGTTSEGGSPEGSTSEGGSPEGSTSEGGSPEGSTSDAADGGAE